MAEDTFRIVVAGIITNEGKVLVGKKEESEGHPISGQWHFPGGHLDRGEEVREGVKREIEEETGLNVKVHRIVDFYRGREDMVRAIFHCEADNGDAEAKDDLDDVKWVEPGDLEENLGEYDSEIVSKRDEVSRFVDKINERTA